MNDQPKRLALAEIIRTAREDFMMRTELFAVVAAETRAKYEAYVAVGFTADEALALCIGATK